MQITERNNGLVRSVLCWIERKTWLDFLSYLLQNASHVPFAFTGLKFFASLTSTCNEPFDDELRELGDDFMLPNFRKPLLIDDREKCDDFVSGGTNFKPTIMSPRYDDMSSNGSLWKRRINVKSNYYCSMKKLLKTTKRNTVHLLVLEANTIVVVGYRILFLAYWLLLHPKNHFVQTYPNAIQSPIMFAIRDYLMTCNIWAIHQTPDSACVFLLSFYVCQSSIYLVVNTPISRKMMMKAEK